MPFHTHTLPSGLTLIGETLPSSRSVSVGFFVRTGSRDETPGEAGVSHFLEHMVFKGTPRRTAFDVNREFDQLGAKYNAYTSEEETVYYASVLPEYLTHVTDILADILRPSLREDDFDTEKQVILEEIKKYDDQPHSVAWDRAKEVYFRGHPLGNSILGTHASVSALTAAQMKAYFDRRYAAGNILVAAAGNFDWAQFVQLVGEKTANWNGAAVAPRSLTPAVGPGGNHAFTKEGIAQQYMLSMAPAPAADSPLRHAANVLAIAVGDDSGSRLHWELVDPGRVESAGCGVDFSHGNGFLAVSMSGDPELAAENLGIVKRVLSEVQNSGLADEEIAQAKNKITSRLVRSSERPMGRMSTIAGAWLYRGEYSDTDAEIALYDAIDAKAIREYLDAYPVDAITTIGYGPLSELG
jgi:predicted Zn-dependent peptidase